MDGGARREASEEGPEAAGPDGLRAPEGVAQVEAVLPLEVRLDGLVVFRYEDAEASGSPRPSPSSAGT